MTTIGHLDQVRDAEGRLEWYSQDGLALAYLDRECRWMCAPCARTAESTPGGQGARVPSAWFLVELDEIDATCTVCSESLDPREADRLRAAEWASGQGRPACTPEGPHIGPSVPGCLGCAWELQGTEAWLRDNTSQWKGGEL